MTSRTTNRIDLNRPAGLRGTGLPAGYGRRPARRRGTVLVLVMALLGILFVMGVTFIATMNSAQESAKHENTKNDQTVGRDDIMAMANQVIRATMIGDVDRPLGSEILGESTMAYVEVMGVENTFDSIEPVRYSDPADPNALPRLVFRTHTDVFAMRSELHDGSAQRKLDEIVLGMQVTDNFEVGPAVSPANVPIKFAGVDSAWVPGQPVPIVAGPTVPPPPPGQPVPAWVPGTGGVVMPFTFGEYTAWGILPLDADGDGISDSLAVDARSLWHSDKDVRDRVPLRDAPLKELAPLLNPPSSPRGRVFVALRVLPHGGIVDLNASHLTLVNNLLSDREGADLSMHRPRMLPEEGQGFYSVVGDEPMLRRRGGGLPPRVLPPSKLLGNPALTDRAQYPYGAGDLARELFAPAGDDEFEKPFTGDHRYWPYTPDELWTGNGSTDVRLWAMRKEPETSFANDPNKAEYDPMHLVTTVSSDDNLARGVRVEARYNANPSDPMAPALGTPLGYGDDMQTLMHDANRFAWSDESCSLTFEYENYPHTLANPIREDGVEACPNDRDPSGTPNPAADPDDTFRKKLNARKGRLKLSIPWLQDRADETADNNTGNDVIDSAQQQRLVHDVFLMLLMNARDRAETWGTYDNPNPGAPDKGEWIPDYLALSRAAASLTANFFDFADGGTSDPFDVPTRVALRNVNFGDFSDANLAAVGRPIDRNGTVVLPGDPTTEFAYGLDRQPFISEVTMVYELWSAGPDGPTVEQQNGPPVAWGVELFNPHATAVVVDQANVQYALVPFDPAADSGEPGYIGTAPRIVIQTALPALAAGSFTVFKAGNNAELPQTGAGVYQLGITYETLLKSGYALALVRRVQYPQDAGVVTEIVVDQFKLEDMTPSAGDTFDPNLPPPSPVISSMRVASMGVPSDPSDDDRWRVPVPWTERRPFGHTLGGNNLGDDNNPVTNFDIRPVEVQFASTPDGKLTSAYPTTGSMLLMMRHANRALPTAAVLASPDFDASDLDTMAFTTQLVGEQEARTWNDPANPPNNTVSLGADSIDVTSQIDNGRMPVFDTGMLHHTDPAVEYVYCTPTNCGPDDPCNLVNSEWASSVPPPGANWSACTQPYPNVRKVTTPRGTDALPWGQLVFDYFTALPLSGEGPYRRSMEDLETGNPEWDPGRSWAAQPRVDDDGLRVHGRINLNAAPWKVLAGLPLIPMNKLQLPADLKVKISAAVPLAADTDPNVPDDDEAAMIGEEFAKAIVAYREARDFKFYGTATLATGDYNAARGWAADDPDWRRGAGFLTVGELANIRSGGFVDAGVQPIAGFAGFTRYRVDGGLVGSNPATEDYVSAVALLVAMGDWTTVRSQVFTVYGTLRGELDLTNTDLTAGDPDFVNRKLIEDADTRAIRFQETIDRLPTWLGAPTPTRIGERVLAGYTDVHND